MEGYTTNNMFQSQDAMLENVEQKNEINVEQPVTKQQEASEQHDQEQEHPGHDDNDVYDHQHNLLHNDEIESVVKESYLMSLWTKLCNLDNIVLIVLAILIAILYKLYA